MLNDEEGDLTNITDPKDTDVLCGRGGAALRHPGNQTYRRLVNLNKQLYITCLKTEKLKISRSIVAAIREQDGRFLERDAKTGTWYDIGDKKAVEKTSQALREGQPKLRQKMVEMGQIPQEGKSNPSPTTSLEQRFSNGMYNARANLTQGIMNNMYAGMPQPTQMHRMGSSADMPPPPARSLSNNDPMMNNSDGLMQKLSISNSVPSWTPSLASAGTSSAGSSRYLQSSSIQQPNSVPSWTPSVNSLNSSLKFSNIQPNSIPSWTPSLSSNMSQISEINRSMSRLKPAPSTIGNGGGGLGMIESNMSLMSQFSGIGNINDSTFGMEIDLSGGTNSNFNSNNNNNNMNNNNNNNMVPPPPPPPPAISPMMMGSPLDRRRFFAKMKYNRPASTIMDGMPDVQMVESNMSLMSNFSNGGFNMSSHGGVGGGGGGSSKHESTLPTFSDHSFGVGSRRSVMSGLSKISDTSGVNSIFSDMSKKISAGSTRSMAMSEITGIEEEDDDDDFDGFNYDTISATKSE